MLEIAGGIFLGTAIVGLLIIVIKKRRKRLNRARSDFEQHSVIGSDILLRK